MEQGSGTGRYARRRRYRLPQWAQAIRRAVGPWRQAATRTRRRHPARAWRRHAAAHCRCRLGLNIGNRPLQLLGRSDAPRCCTRAGVVRPATQIDAFERRAAACGGHLQSPTATAAVCTAGGPSPRSRRSGRKGTAFRVPVLLFQRTVLPAIWWSKQAVRGSNEACASRRTKNAGRIMKSAERQA